MNVIEPMTPVSQATIARRGYHRPDAPKRDTAVMRVRDFTALMKIIAAHDLWDALEAEMAVQGCTSFRVGAQPMRIASGVLRRRIRHGDLPADTPGLFAACSSLGGSSEEGEAAGAAGNQGAAGAAGAATRTGGDVLPVGESEGSKDKPQ